MATPSRSRSTQARSVSGTSATRGRLPNSVRRSSWVPARAAVPPKQSRIRPTENTSWLESVAQLPHRSSSSLCRPSRTYKRPSLILPSTCGSLLMGLPLESVNIATAKSSTARPRRSQPSQGCANESARMSGPAIPRPALAQSRTIPCYPRAIERSGLLRKIEDRLAR